MKTRREVKVNEVQEVLTTDYQKDLENQSLAIVTRQKVKVSQEFVMLFVVNAQRALNEFTKTEFKILLSIAKFAQYKNVFSVTQAAISEDCGVDQSDVSRAMKKFRDKDYLLKHPTNGLEYLNPNLFAKGGITQLRADKKGIMAALDQDVYKPENTKSAPVIKNSMQRVI